MGSPTVKTKDGTGPKIVSALAMRRLKRVYRLIAAAAVFAALMGALFSGCSDAQMGKLTSLGSEAKVVCFSGGVQIYAGCSTGKVASEQNSDGYYFRDKKSGRNVEISGNCVIDYGSPSCNG